MFKYPEDDNALYQDLRHEVGTILGEDKDSDKLCRVYVRNAFTKLTELHEGVLCVKTSSYKDLDLEYRGLVTFSVILKEVKYNRGFGSSFFGFYDLHLSFMVCAKTLQLKLNKDVKTKQ